MSSAARQRYLTMLGGVQGVPTPPVDPCPDYDMPLQTAANVALEEVLAVLAQDAANTNLCEELV